jgi:hypothetical protein
MRGVITIQENEPYMSTYFELAQLQQTTQTEPGSRRVEVIPGGVESSGPPFQGPRRWEDHSRGCHLGIGPEQVGISQYHRLEEFYSHREIRRRNYSADLREILGLAAEW